MSPEPQDILNSKSDEERHQKLRLARTKVLDEFLVEVTAKTALRRMVMSDRERRSHRVVWWALLVAIASMIFAAIAAWPILRSWIP